MYCKQFTSITSYESSYQTSLPKDYFISFESIDFNLQRKSTNIFLIYECSFSLIYNFIDSGKKHTHTHTHTQDTQGLYYFMFLICKRHCHRGNNKTACSLADTACRWKQRDRNKALIIPMNSFSSWENKRRLCFPLSNNVL